MERTAAINVQVYYGELLQLTNEETGDTVYVQPTEEPKYLTQGYRRQQVLNESFWFRPEGDDNWTGPYNSREEAVEAIDDAYLGDDPASTETYSIVNLPEQKAASDVSAYSDTLLGTFGGEEDEGSDMMDAALADVFGVDVGDGIDDEMPL